MDDTKLKQYFGARIKEIRESRGLNIFLSEKFCRVNF